MRPAFLRPALPVRLTRSQPRSRFIMTSPPPQLGESPVLFVKAGKDGVALGDCPFSQKANLSLRFQNIDFTVDHINLKDKPQWFLDLNEDGTTPVYVDQTLAIGDSEEIIEHADKIATTGFKLIREDDPNWQKAYDAVAPIFGSLVRLLKNKDDEKEDELKAALTDALVQLDQYLASIDSKYLLSDTVSSLDCNLAPKLEHIIVAAGHYKSFTIPETCEMLLNYIQNFKETEQWQQTVCEPSEIIYGWSKFF